MKTSNKEILKKINLLYVEDDNVVRTELSKLLLNFFNNVYIAKDGLEGLDLFFSEEIDIIISDINMPSLNGIDMIKEVRKTNKDIPVILTTAFSDNEFLLEAIKLKIDEYIIKPVDIRVLIEKVSKIAKTLYQSTLLDLNIKELSKFKEVIDSTNIVIKTDKKMKITYVNELFCKISGYSKDELIGKDFKDLKHKDMSDDIYISLYADVLNNVPWSGTLKNIKNNGGSYTTDCYMITQVDDNKQIVGTISIQKDITEEQNKKREIQLALMRDKSDIFKRSQEGSLELTLKINDLTSQLKKAQEDLNKALNSIDKYMHNAQKSQIEIKNLKLELGLFKKHETHTNSFKLTKKNSDLKIQVKRLNEKINYLREVNEKEILNIELQHELIENEYKDTIEKLNEKLDTLQNDEVLVEKLSYWKEKAIEESKKLESLEKKIINVADEKFLGKIFE